jgi:cytolysin-activating lysine-acyltransferase
MDIDNKTVSERAAQSTAQVNSAKRAQASGLFGEIVHLLMQSPPHKHLFLSDLEWLVLPPFRNKQFRVFYHEDTAVGVAFWARVSDAVDAELDGGRDRLRADEWHSGDKLWLMDLVAPSFVRKPKVIEMMLAELSQKAFEGRPFKFRRVDRKTGKTQASTVGLRSKPQAEAMPAP